MERRDDAERLAALGWQDLPPAEEGLFRSGSWLRRVHAEPALLVGGGRALLLEVAHPLVAAGVARHSRFRDDPFGRLRRTLDAVGRIIYGDRAAALAAADEVARAHERVRGTLGAPAGPFAGDTAYGGRDPELVLWVWATLADTALVVTERFVAPLEDRARAAYLADQGRIARLLGVPEALVPRDAAAFDGYVREMVEGDRLTVTDEAREIAEAVLDPPGGLPGGGAARGLTAWLLPPRLREAFGLPWGPEREARAEATARSVRALRRPAAAVDSAGPPR